MLAHLLVNVVVFVQSGVEDRVHFVRAAVYRNFIAVPPPPQTHTHTSIRCWISCFGHVEYSHETIRGYSTAATTFRRTGATMEQRTLTLEIKTPRGVEILRSVILLWYR